MSTTQLPRALRAQAAQVEQWDQQQREAQAQAQTQPPASLSQPTESTPAADAPTPVPNEPNPQPQPQHSPAPEPQPPSNAPPRDELAAAEQRFRTLEGMLKSDLKQLRDSIRAGEQREAELQRRVEQLATRAPESKDSRGPDPKDIETFGADMLDMVRRQAKVEIEQAVQQHISSVLERLQRLEGTVQGVGQNVAVTAEQQFYSALKGLVPDWTAINSDQRFLDWLATIDPIYGEPRQMALDRASHSLSPERTAAVFDAFKATLPKPKQAEAEAEVSVSPSRGASAPPPNAGTQPVQYVSTSDIEKFYNDVARGRYNGRDAEVQRIQDAIDLAQAENRIR